MQTHKHLIPKNPQPQLLYSDFVCLNTNRKKCEKEGIEEENCGDFFESCLHIRQWFFRGGLFCRRRRRRCHFRVPGRPLLPCLWPMVLFVCVLVVAQYSTLMGQIQMRVRTSDLLNGYSFLLLTFSFSFLFQFKCQPFDYQGIFVTSILNYFDHFHFEKWSKQLFC